MAKNGLRCLGGSQHGQFKQLPAGMRSLRVHYGDTRRYIQQVAYSPTPEPTFDIETYELRELTLDNTRVSVLVLDRLTDRAANRALADLIEGVQR